MTEITLADRLATVAMIVEFLTTNANGTTPELVVESLKDVRVRDGLLHQLATNAFTIEGFVLEGHEQDCDEPDKDHTKMNACILLDQATDIYLASSEDETCDWVQGTMSAIALLDGEEQIASVFALQAGDNSLARLILQATTMMPEGKASEVFLQSILNVGDLEATVKGAS